MTEKKIPLKDLAAQYRALESELGPAIQEFLASGQYVLGPAVEGFEREAAAYLGAGHCVGVGSGTDALLITLRALGVGEGDEVVTTPFTFVASADVIARLRAKPVFVDVDPRTLNISPAAAAEAVTSRTKVVMPVHLYGLPADVPALAEAAPGIPILEDAAQAMGASWRAARSAAWAPRRRFRSSPAKTWALSATAAWWPPTTPSWRRARVASAFTARRRRITPRK